MKKAFAIAALGLALAAACTTVPPVRVLPKSIGAIYVPMFENQSYEPGLEEKLTRLTQEEFLADGRLDVVPRRNADAVLVGKIKKFDIRARNFGRDEFPRTSRLTIVADVSLYDPSDRKRENPLMTWKDINIDYSFESDARFSGAWATGGAEGVGTSPQDAYKDALRQLAREIVFTVLTKKPDENAMEEAAPGVRPPAPPRPVLGREKLDTRLLDNRSSPSAPVANPAQNERRP